MLDLTWFWSDAVDFLIRRSQVRSLPGVPEIIKDSGQSLSLFSCWCPYRCLSPRRLGPVTPCQSTQFRLCHHVVSFEDAHGPVSAQTHYLEKVISSLPQIVDCAAAEIVEPKVLYASAVTCRTKLYGKKLGHVSEGGFYKEAEKSGFRLEFIRHNRREKAEEISALLR